MDPTMIYISCYHLAEHAPHDSTVSELIDDDTGEWKVALVKQIFSPSKAQTILGIPRSHQRANDRMVWAYTPKGNFTINNTYKVAIAMSQNTTSEGASTNDMMSRFWEKIWSLGLPNKLKTFAWKASRNILPTKVNLYRRGVIDNATCDACGLAEETSGHLFWDCTKAREHMGNDLVELVVIVAWCMWYNRNKVRLGSTRQTSQEIIHKARSTLNEFQLAHFAPPLFKEQADPR
ncbi:uncharacterized protein LOC142625013 [Castanea sativa]|uniref:uncharacterized protein LOC142625013 n=1 Tax=Castanea sativa TaxID=21020 RepID=UPI003F6529C3